MMTTQARRVCYLDGHANRFPGQSNGDDIVKLVSGLECMAVRAVHKSGHLSS